MKKAPLPGPSHRRVGKIEQASGGTVFLDEIGDMPLSIQAKFCDCSRKKVLSDWGARADSDVDVRIIAATNRDLETAVAAGTFREDLYYRLRVVTITMPPLRQRPDDVTILTDYLLARLARELAAANPGITPEALVKITVMTGPAISENFPIP